MIGPGSSPHTRGLLVNCHRVELAPRIIPAHAGFTSSTERKRGITSDHPRTRGVYPRKRWCAVSVLGSSPHTRGLPRHRRRPGGDGRIIPAHAGFTGRTARRSRRAGDHPRTRGVYMGAAALPVLIAGSSPHTRGLLAVFTVELRRVRIIPAHAGFTLGDPWNPNGPGVYHPPVSFTADLVPARRSCGSAAVEPRWTRTPWAA